MTLPGGTRLAAAVTSGRSRVRSLRPRSCRCTRPSGSRKSMQRSPSHLTSKRYSGELNGASAAAACMGRSSFGKLSSSIWSWLESTAPPRLAGALRGFAAGLLGFGGLSLLARGARLLRGVDRCAQRFHEVHYLRGLRRRRRFDDFAVDLRLYDPHHRLSVLVLVAAGVERIGEAFDQRLRHVELFGVDLHLTLETLQTLGRANLIRPVKRVHEQGVAGWVQSGEVLSVTQRDLGDGHLSGGLERRAQEVVWLLAQLFGLDVVGAVEVQTWLDVVPRNDLVDVDAVRGRERDVVQVLVVDDDVAVLADLEALEDLAVLNLVVALRAPTLVADRRSMLGTQLSERDFGA